MMIEFSDQVAKWQYETEARPHRDVEKLSSRSSHGSTWSARVCAQAELAALMAEKELLSRTEKLRIEQKALELDTKIAMAKAREGVFIAAEKQDTLSDIGLDGISEVTKDVRHQQDTFSDLGLDNLFIPDVTRDSATGYPGEFMEVHDAPKTDITGAMSTVTTAGGMSRIPGET